MTPEERATEVTGKFQWHEDAVAGGCLLGGKEAIEEAIAFAIWNDRNLLQEAFRDSKLSERTAISLYDILNPDQGTKILVSKANCLELADNVLSHIAQRLGIERR